MNINKSIKRKWFLIKKKPRSSWYPAETMTDVDYADNLVLLTNTSTQDDSLLYSKEEAVRGLNKKESSPLNDKPLQLYGHLPPLSKTIQ